VGVTNNFVWFLQNVLTDWKLLFCLDIHKHLTERIYIFYMWSNKIKNMFIQQKYWRKGAGGSSQKRICNIYNYCFIYFKNRMLRFVNNFWIFRSVWQVLYCDSLCILQVHKGKLNDISVLKAFQEFGNGCVKYHAYCMPIFEISLMVSKRKSRRKKGFLRLRLLL
jgi:hypothetical protein